MVYLKKSVGDFNFIRIPKFYFTLNRLELSSINPDIKNNTYQYEFILGENTNFNQILENLKKKCEKDTIVNPVKMGKLIVNSYNVKSINQTIIKNTKNILENPIKGDICDLELMVDNIYSFKNNPDIFRFKIKAMKIEVIY